ncbi:MAG: CRISPR-associated helicase Cas3' [Eubacterium sp.]|nr:CRISPR-associated helicase Cas3' [Eubacterium sp.]
MKCISIEKRIWKPREGCETEKDNQIQIRLNPCQFLAHVDAETKRVQYLHTHLQNVAYLAEKNCPLELMRHMAALAAFLHDMGKLGEFQEYMQDILKCGGTARQRRIDHSSAGGRLLEEMTNEAFVSKLVGTAIYSHHGLQDCIDMETGESVSERRRKKDLDFASVKQRFYQIFPKEDLLKLAQAAHRDCKLLFEHVKKVVQSQGGRDEFGNIEFYLGMYERLLLSLLIDSDWSDSADFSEDAPIEERGCGKSVKEIWEASIKHFERYIESLASSDGQQSPLNAMRNEISDLCYRASEEGGRRYRLTVPTGAGKTFSSLRFALYCARKFDRRHIIYVAPYNSILEQNAEDIRKAVGNEAYVLEHHCNLIQEDEEKEARYKKLTERWDSPIIVTTAVQLLNTLFSGQKSSIRRMRALCGSVIIFDEIQAIPVRCTELFHLAVNFLSEFCDTTVVLCSATQPSLAKLKENNLMKCEEMAGNPQSYAEAFRRVTIEDRTDAVPGGMRIDDLKAFILEAFQTYHSTLVIVNTKAAAKEVYQALKESAKEECELYHLSTNMCPKNRNDELNAIKAAQKKRKKMICVSTQLVEAGVNLSFGCVIRSIAGLDSIIQAAGRCNRHKERDGFGKVYIVKLTQEAEHIEKLFEIKHARTACERLLYEFRQSPEAFGHALDSQSAIFRFYKLYYHELGANVTKYPSSIGETSLVELLGKNEMGRMQYFRKHRGIMPKGPLQQAFQTAGEEFEVISDDAKVSVFISYDETARQLMDALETERSLAGQKKLLQRLQPYTVGISPFLKEKLKHAIYPIGDTGALALNMDYYDTKLGVLEMSQNRFLDF